MSYFSNLQKTAKNLPIAIWIAGLIIPGGFAAIAVYTAYKAGKKDIKEQTLNEFMDQVLKEEKDDRSEDSSG